MSMKMDKKRKYNNQNMTLQEKISLLQGAGSSGILPDVEGVEYDDGKAYLRKDLRRYISDTLASEGVSVRQLSIAVGMNYSNMVQYLKGTRTLPEKYLERVLGLIENPD